MLAKDHILHLEDPTKPIPREIVTIAKRKSVSDIRCPIVIAGVGMRLLPEENRNRPSSVKIIGRNRKAIGKRRNHPYRAIRDSSSKRSRIEAHVEMERATRIPLHSPQKDPLKFSTAPTDVFRSCQSGNSSSERNVFDSHRNRHLADELGIRHAV